MRTLVGNRLRIAVLTVAGASLCGSITAQVTDPVVIRWRQNLNGAVGASTDATINQIVRQVPADVQEVRYDATYAYVRASGIPSHYVGPFPGNPNRPSNQNATFRIPRSPRPAANPAATGLGPIALAVNGVALYNMSDGRSYFNQGVWNNNAFAVESRTFDVGAGHPQQRGQYHYHNLPPALLEQLGERYGNAHSPLLGYAFDGYPIYGPYGYANTNGTGGVRRMVTSWAKRNITARTTLPGNVPLQPGQYGPAISALYPLGYFIEDYEYVANLGDLDQHNGRQCVTPDYPNGVYAYFATVDSAGAFEYPYLLGPTYYGVNIAQRNVSIPANAQTHQNLVQKTGSGEAGFALSSSGNPTVPNASFALSLASGPANGTAWLYFAFGLEPAPVLAGTNRIYLNLTSLVTLVSLQASPIGPWSLDGAGSYNWPFPIPNQPSLSGSSVDLQAVGFDGSNTIYTSNALTLKFQ